MNFYLAGEVFDSWDEVLATFPDHTGQWQDLDGLHQSPLPQNPPMASLIHGWNTVSSTLIRLRWDGERAFVARLSQKEGPLGRRRSEEVAVQVHTTVAWGDLGQVAQAKGPAALAREQMFEHLDVLDTGQGGLLFIRLVGRR